MLKLPSIIFYIVWPILYTFLLVSILLFYKFPPTQKSLYKWGLIFFWLNIFFNILYLIFAFAMANDILSLIDLFLLVFTAIATLILFLKSDSRQKITISILYMFYTLWLCFALLISLL